MSCTPSSDGRTSPPHLWWVVAVALYTGQRQGDVLAMLKSDVRRAEGRGTALDHNAP